MTISLDATIVRDQKPESSSIAHADKVHRPSPKNIVRIEKNLTSLGFFTPSNKKIKGASTKTVVFGRQIEGRRVVARVVILPSAAYGLPVTSDQDKYLVVCVINNFTYITDLAMMSSHENSPDDFPFDRRTLYFGNLGTESKHASASRSAGADHSDGG